jgi:hypothetical protein
MFPIIDKHLRAESVENNAQFQTAVHAVDKAAPLMDNRPP